MRKLKICILVISILFSYSALHAQIETAELGANDQPTSSFDLKTQWGIGLKGGIPGFGAEVIKGFGNRVNLRIGYAGLSIPMTRTIPLEEFSIKAEAKVRLGGASALVDYYPVKNVIHFTIGLLQNRTLVDLKVSTPDGIPQGDLIIPAEDVGFAFIEMTTPMPVCPYLALGFGNTLSREKRVSFNFEFGAFRHGAPDFYMDGEGLVAPAANETNENVFNTAFGPYPWIPVVNMQLSFRIL